jgi:putative DNA methylase
VEPTVRQAVRLKVKEFQEAGIGGIDLYLACFGPALQVFTEAWPLTRGTARPQPKTKQRDLFEEFDPYAVRPEDALEAARREVKQWRMEQLATVKRQHHLDALTEWYVLAWDAFRAPRFPADEALKLARVVGLDFDQDVKKQVCEVKGDDVILWDSITRHRNGSLRHVSEECMLDVLHWAAKTGREQNTGAARNLIEEAHLIGDPTLLDCAGSAAERAAAGRCFGGQEETRRQPHGRGQRLRSAGAPAQAGLRRDGPGAEDSRSNSQIAYPLT